jgi:hypothetical protein
LDFASFRFVSNSSTLKTLFAFLLATEGATEKVLKFIVPMKPNYNKNICFAEENVFLNTLKRLKQENDIFVIRLLFCLPFRAAPVRLGLNNNKIYCSIL